MSKKTGTRTPVEEKSAEKVGPARPSGPRWLRMALFAVAPTVLLLLVLEAALRLADFGGSVALVVPLRCDDGTVLYTLNPHSARRFFFRQVPGVKIAGSATYHETFAARKPSDTVRIFVVGASAALGYPYAKNVSFATYLESILKRRYPGGEFEVINCGITAVSSYVVLDNVRELARYSPDLIVVYSGHNEFYGTYAPTSAVASWQWRPAVMAFMRFQRTKLYLLLKGLVEKWTASPPGEAGPKSRAHLIGSMARNEHIRLDGPLYRRVERNYRRNLEAMAAAASRRGVPIVFCTLAANERDCGPLRSQHRPDLSKDDLRLWRECFAEGRAALADGDTSRAVALFRRCVEIDPEYADAHFLLARSLEKSGDPEGAAKAYRSALDLDGMRFRAGSRFNSLIREVVERARRRGRRVALADVEQAIRAGSEKRLIGLDLVIDHVHLRARGIYLAAVEMVRSAEANGLLDLAAPTLSTMPTFEQCNRDTGYNALDELVALDLMTQLFGDYPFDRLINGQEVLERLHAEIDHLKSGLDPVARSAYEAWLRDRRAYIHNLAANLYYRAGRFADSAREVEALLRQSDGYDGMTIGFLFHLYMCQSQRKDLDENERQKAMEETFQRARRLFTRFGSRPRGNAMVQYLFMGKFYSVRQRWREAIPLLEKAIELDPANKDAYEFLLQAYAQTLQREKALALARKLIKIDPNNRFASMVIRAASGRPPAESPRP